MPRACETDATKKSFVRQKTVRTKQGASVEGGRNASTANFKQEAGGPAQSFRDQD